ncbi:NAD-specific glutamate dehydrogenase [Vibrio stylophorae]|uniref:NAD-specific glutamate dehydrogenase n=1 Tax=Vibrio stylophorae TaxID=659351 RepID=A0ABM8ZT28_9VIBR|nr:NAD-glutamate dehydrogenase [Vibrio stylophorae]CAH0533471.1 NAD-specific glutamate dehydrogenase [Vibrio stylophorae]
MKQSVTHHSVTINKLHSLIDTHLSLTEAKLLHQFCGPLLASASENDLLQRHELSLYGALLNLWHRLNQTAPNQSQIQVYHPSLKVDGWQSALTVIQLIVPDRPFLVDSIFMALAEQDLSIEMVLYGPQKVQQSEKGKVTAIGKGVQRSFFHIEIEPLNAKARHALAEKLAQVLREVALVVDDWQPMQQKLKDVIDLQGERLDSRSQKFLAWLVAHNFTFLGYRYFELKPIAGDHQIVPNLDSALGIFRLHQSEQHPLSELPMAAQYLAKNETQLILTKSSQRASVHRPAYMDYIGLKVFSPKGKVIGEHRFLGLYAQSLYNQSVLRVPLLGEKVRALLLQSGFAKNSHDWKSLLNFFETYPRDELFQANDEELLSTGLGVIRMRDREMLRLFVRRDPFARFLSCMVYVSRDRYSTALRRKTQALLQQTFASPQEVEFQTFFSESRFARTQYIVHLDQGLGPIDIHLLEQNMRALATSWQDRLNGVLIEQFGLRQGKALAKRYQDSWHEGYRQTHLASAAVTDIEYLERLTPDQPLAMLLYRPPEDAGDSSAIRLKLYQYANAIALSEVVPMLENMGLQILSESPSPVHVDGQIHWILDFKMWHRHGAINLAEVRERFESAFTGVWFGQYENDGFNQLILQSGFDAKQVSLLRALAKYLKQIGFPLSQQAIEQCLIQYSETTQQLVAFFEARFSLQLTATKREKQQNQIRQQIERALKAVISLDDDRILRQYLSVMQSMLRCNYYQSIEQQSGRKREMQEKAWLSFKLNSHAIEGIPKPIPAFEIFVYAPWVEGIHLRGGAIARGGLRWSDRLEDFRTEILGLVKAQQVKNSVIVPVGAKGGFVCKQLAQLERSQWAGEGQRCYQTFIRGLLDLTDNIVDQVIVPPPQVYCYDAPDPYLVVAADKGTATFSDLANQTAAEYSFWLKDAFASGGSQGYDHKVMGITARGAWESVKRHFREMGIDSQQDYFECIGIGDMAGDVFGNGMLLSPSMGLVAAFNHQHIFIDPTPNVKAAYQERCRLFQLPRSSWLDYDAKLISPGGGIFERSAKSIALSAQMKARFGIDRERLTPNELIQFLLRSPVDLLWNGGIGTYVKAKEQSHLEVGDRANDTLRINGHELGAKVVGEGGNLGFTQAGRIEYALAGGRINTDFVDNVGGVDCSDHEVNIKILLEMLLAQGDLTQKQRNAQLKSMTDDVTKAVLANAYEQSESISVTQCLPQLLKEQLRFLDHLEKHHQFDRHLESMPSDELLIERAANGQGLTRPELAILTAQAKMVLKAALLALDVHWQGKVFDDLLIQYFPPLLQENNNPQLSQHRLCQEIIATALANQIVNDMGPSFVSRLQDETGASLMDILSAYQIARHVLNLDQWQQQVRELDNQIEARAQYDILLQLRRWLRRATRWLLRHPHNMSLDEGSVFYADYGQQLFVYLNSDSVTICGDLFSPAKMADNKIEMKKEVVDKYHALVSGLSLLPMRLRVFDMAQISQHSNTPLTQVAALYHQLDERLELTWFEQLIDLQVVENHWQALARATLREDLAMQQRIMVERVIEQGCSTQVERWLAAQPQAMQRWLHMVSEFKVGQRHEFAKFSVALRELALFNLNCLSNQ